MAKTIKFNLILDDKPVRTIEDLRENFSIENILELYNNGLLKRWLEVRGYSELLEKVKSIKSDNNVELIQKLIKIFDVECDENKIKEGIEILEYTMKRKGVLEKYEKLNYETKLVIDDYHSGYRELINGITENYENMPKIKASIKEIEENYMDLFIINFYDIYYKLIHEAPLSIFAMLMSRKMKNYFISSEYANDHAKEIFRHIQKFVSTDMILSDKLGNEIKSFKGNTEAYWKDIEPKNKKFMVISMESGNYVRNAGTFGEELSSDDINNKFVILDGIDYKSNNDYHELLYMEV